MLCEVVSGDQLNREGTRSGAQAQDSRLLNFRDSVIWLLNHWWLELIMVGTVTSQKLAYAINQGIFFP